MRVELFRLFKSLVIGACKIMQIQMKKILIEMSAPLDKLVRRLVRRLSRTTSGYPERRLATPG